MKTKNPWKKMSEERKAALAKACAEAWLAIPAKPARAKYGAAQNPYGDRRFF